MRYLLILLALAGTLAGQTAGRETTRIRAVQVKEPPVAAASVRIVMPSGAVVYAQLAADSFVLDTTTSPPTLRIKAAPATTIEYHQVWRDANGGNGFTLPTGTLISVYRNGLLQMPTTDYTVAGTVMTLMDPCCESDEIVTVSIRR
jgi:hypothetical protein